MGFRWTVWIYYSVQICDVIRNEFTRKVLRIVQKGGSHKNCKSDICGSLISSAQASGAASRWGHIVSGLLHEKHENSRDESIKWGFSNPTVFHVLVPTKHKESDFLRKFTTNCFSFLVFTNSHLYFCRQ